MQARAVILVSGGLDSATVLALAKDQGFIPYALTVLYGQRHAVELEASKKVALSFQAAEHRILELDLRPFGGSALTSSMPVPVDRSDDDMTAAIPITYVPARNTIFLGLALAWAEVLGSRDIFIGVNALDYSGYPDCRPEFIRAFEEVANLGTKAGVVGEDRIRIHAPLVDLTKKEIVELGIALGVDYSLTHSCYDPGSLGEPCGRCDSCILRQKGFDENGIPDPALARFSDALRG